MVHTSFKAYSSLLIMKLIVKAISIPMIASVTKFQLKLKGEKSFSLELPCAMRVLKTL